MFDQYELAAPETDLPTQTPEAVTFKSLTAEGTYSSPGYNLTQARRGAQKEEYVQGSKMIVKRTVPWRIWAADLVQAGFTGTPKNGDQIVDANNVIYLLNEVNTILMGAAFDCVSLVDMSS